MNIYAARSSIESHEVFFKFTDSANGAFQHFLDENAFLRVDYLVIAFLKFFENIDVFDIQTSQVMENVVIWPRRNIFNALFIELWGQSFDLYLFLEVVEGIGQL